MFASIKKSLLLVCALALFATACGGSSEPSEVSSAAQGSDSADQSASSSPSASTESPLGDLLGIPIGNDDEADEYFSELSRQAEVSIAECMLAQGFEYEVVDYSGIEALGTSVDFDSREFAEEYGFGISSNPFEESFEAFESFEDPNQKYIESLSEGERDAYEQALYGELPDFDSDDFEGFEPAGCQGEAFESVFAFGEVFDTFGDAFEELEEEYDADPRIVQASAGWSDCMNEAGYRYTDFDSAEADFDQRYNTIVRAPDAFADVEALPPEEVTEDVGVTEDVFVFGPQSLNPEAQAKVDELAVEERAVAVAAWDCNAPVREIEDEVRLEMEQRFVDENGAAIREMLDG